MRRSGRPTRCRRPDRGTLAVRGTMARTLRSDKLLFWSMLLLIGLGLLMVYSASAVQAVNKGRPASYFLVRQLAWVAVGLPLLLGAMRLDYHNLRKPAVIWTVL